MWTSAEEQSESLLNRSSRLNVLLAQRPSKEKLEQMNVIRSAVSPTLHSLICPSTPPSAAHSFSTPLLTPFSSFSPVGRRHSQQPHRRPDLPRLRPAQGPPAVSHRAPSPLRRPHPPQHPPLHHLLHPLRPHRPVAAAAAHPGASPSLYPAGGEGAAGPALTGGQ